MTLFKAIVDLQAGKDMAGNELDGAPEFLVGAGAGEMIANVEAAGFAGVVIAAMG